MVTVGANIGNAAGTAIPYDHNQKFSLPTPAVADTVSWTAMQTPGPALYVNSTPLDPRQYPLQTNIPGVAFDPAALGQVTIAPLSATVAALATKQLQAIGINLDGSTVNITGAVTWASSDATKATVSAAGLVTGVATGSAAITATLGSLVGTSAITIP